MFYNTLFSLIFLVSQAQAPADCAAPAVAENPPVAGVAVPCPALEPTPEEREADDEADEEKERRWFFLVGVVSAYPKLESERILKDIFDPVVSFLAPGYDGTNTFTDMRDKGLLLPPQVSIGRILSDKFALSLHGGYSEGVVRTDRREASLLFGIPLHTRVGIRPYSTYLGLDLDYYPVGMAVTGEYKNWGERLRAAKPTLGVRLNYNRTGYDARIRMGLGWIGRGFAVHLEDKWALPGITLVGGVDIPLNPRSVLIFNAGYTWFRDQTQDFNGPAVTLGWRYLF